MTEGSVIFNSRQLIVNYFKLLESKHASLRAHDSFMLNENKNLNFCQLSHDSHPPLTLVSRAHGLSLCAVLYFTCVNGFLPSCSSTSSLKCLVQPSLHRVCLTLDRSPSARLTKLLVKFAFSLFSTKTSLIYHTTHTQHANRRPNVKAPNLNPWDRSRLGRDSRPSRYKAICTNKR